MFIPLLFVSTSLGEAGVSAILRRLEKGHLSLERTLLMGNPRRLQAWLAQAGNLTDAGIDVAGYVWQPPAGEDGLPPLGAGEIPWLGAPSDMVETVHRYRISQVVFWDRPMDGPDTWLQLAGLRRLRVGLRWNLEDVWLLASGARVEDFAGGLSAVQSHGSTAAIKSAMTRVGSILFGGAMALWTWLPWLWLQFVRTRRGAARTVRIKARDLWGNDPSLSVATGSGGQVLSLPWQFGLMISLVMGKVRLVGPKAVLGCVRFHPEDSREMAGFWKDEPGAPGLTGPWARTPEVQGQSVAKGSVSLFSLIKQLWCDPGGFGVVGSADAEAGIPNEARPGHEVS